MAEATEPRCDGDRPFPGAAASCGTSTGTLEDRRSFGSNAGQTAAPPASTAWRMGYQVAQGLEARNVVSRHEHVEKGQGRRHAAGQRLVVRASF
jgi:hypothetical protein